MININRENAILNSIMYFFDYECDIKNFENEIKSHRDYLNGLNFKDDIFININNKIIFKTIRVILSKGFVPNEETVRVILQKNKLLNEKMEIHLIDILIQNPLVNWKWHIEELNKKAINRILGVA